MSFFLLHRRKVHPKKQSMNAYVVFKDEEGVAKALERCDPHEDDPLLISNIKRFPQTRSHSALKHQQAFLLFVSWQERHGDRERLSHPSGQSDWQLISESPVILTWPDAPPPLNFKSAEVCLNRSVNVLLVLQHDHKRSVFVGNLSFGEPLCCLYIDDGV